MTKATPSNEPEDVTQNLHIEKELLPRLKFMGYVMSTFCVAAFLFALIAPKGPDSTVGSVEGLPSLKTSGPILMTDEEGLELNPTEVLNFYAVSLTFFLVGASCFLIVWKKNKTFL